MTTVLKLGGELLEGASDMRAMAAAVRTFASEGPLVVVHGGGRAIDAELRARGLEARFVDGIRITDAPALDAVVSVLAGRTNTTFVAALHAAGVRGVGLTGADDGIGASERAAPYVAAAGALVDLGLVGRPVASSVPLLQRLAALGYVPVVASIGVSADGALLNVNADTLAGHLARALGARRLIIAGATAGVLDRSGARVEHLGLEDIDAMITSGDAHSGMVAKLRACRDAVDAGVEEVRILSGRDLASLASGAGTVLQRGATASPR